MTRRYPVEEITWHDHYAVSRWHPERDTKEQVATPLVCVTVGYRVAEGKDRVGLALQYCLNASADLDFVQYIEKKLIVKRKVLRK